MIKPEDFISNVYPEKPILLVVEKNLIVIHPRRAIRFFGITIGRGSRPKLSKDTKISLRKKDFKLNKRELGIIIAELKRWYNE